MQFTARRLVVVGACGAAAQSSLEAPHLWAAFKARHGSVFEDDVEEARRYAVFSQSLAFIEAENAKGNNYTLGITRFADLSDDEFAAAYSGMGEPPASVGSPLLGEHSWDGSELPSSVDWSAQGAVTAVKDQAKCGSCWAFSATGALEGAYQISSGTLVPLSEQQFVDCPKWGGLLGCRGGVMDAAFDWAHETDLCTGESFPYVAEEHEECDKAGSCEVAISKGSVVGHRRVAHPRFGHPSEQDLMSAVAQQPVSVAIEADKAMFKLYTGGVISGRCGGGLDHGVLLVGYGTTDDGVDFWKVKNSWGDDWGMAGYVHLLRGKGRTGECGILKMASFPVMQGSEAVVV